MNNKKLRTLLTFFLGFALVITFMNIHTDTVGATTVNGTELVKYAQTFLNMPYTKGEAGPAKFDNWGFTKYVYNHFGITLSNSVGSQSKQGTLIKKGTTPKVGDLVFFGYSSTKPIHVGIYIGNNKFIGSYSKDGKVTIRTGTGDFKKYYLGAKRILTSSTSTVTPTTSTSTRDQLATKVVEASKKYLGVPYKLGADYEADGSYKFDCSSFTQQVFDDVGIHLPRTATQQYNMTKHIADSELQVGDLVYFDTDLSGGMNHVGIYLGNGDFIHASTAKNHDVQISNMVTSSYWKKVYMYATRVF